MKVTSGGRTVDAIVVMVRSDRVVAVLPSNTPVGDATLTVTVNGQTSAPVSFKVVRSAFGIFALNQAGSGPGVLVNTATNTPVTFVAAAQPGEALDIWGTGLGPVSWDETKEPPEDFLSHQLDAEVIVGGKSAQVVYAGRSGCCAGIDQVRFIVPEGISGCSVPVVVKTGNVLSNYTTIAIAREGRVCSDPSGFSAAELEAATANGGLRIATVILSRVDLKYEIPGAPPARVFTESGVGTFHDMPVSQLIASQAYAGTTSLESCYVYQFRGQDSSITDPVSGTPLDAGPAILVRGPKGVKNIPVRSVGTYTEVLGGDGRPEFLDPGTYEIDNGPGGTAVGPFRATIQLPQLLNWANQASISTVTRSEGQTITWTGGDPNGTVMIVGTAFTGEGLNLVGASFVCREQASAGQFHIPSSVLLALPATDGNIPGMLVVGNSTNPVRFQATGLDVGYLGHTDLSGKSVHYK